MSAHRQVLSVIPVPGMRATSIGAYLAGLGLLKVLSRWQPLSNKPPAWPDVRAAWRDGVFHLVGGPTDRDALAVALMNVADQASWTPYERGWADAQKASTKAKSSAKLALWQAQADEANLELFAAHAAPASRVYFNPLLGSGGNAGKRAFADGWKKATEALQPLSKISKKGANSDDRREALNALLEGEASSWQAKDLNAASWFSDANKLYNSGQRPYSDGLGRVDGFNQHQPARKTDDGRVAYVGLLAAHGDPFEPFEFADCLFDARPQFVEALRKKAASFL